MAEAGRKCRLSIAHATMSGAEGVGIELTAGMAYIEDVLFSNCKSPHVRIGPDIRGAVVRGLFSVEPKGVRVHNQAGERAQLDIGPGAEPASRRATAQPDATGGPVGGPTAEQADDAQPGR